MSRQSFTYLVSGDNDRLWGITVDNVGEYFVPANYDCYPPLVGHPENYFSISVRAGLWITIS